MKSILVAKLALVSVLPMLAACQTTQTSLGAISHASFCSLAEPIYFSKADTELTKKQVRELNAIGKKLCGWKGKPK